MKTMRKWIGILLCAALLAGLLSACGKDQDDLEWVEVANASNEAVNLQGYKLVKMDKEFVWNCLDKSKPENLRMLEYSIGFLKDYGLHILAEGVETVEQAEILVEKGVEYLQGFYYSRPIPENEYIEFLKAQKGERQ